MKKNQSNYRIGGIHPYDGYRSEPIWKRPDYDSTYYDPELDNQCHVPAHSLEQLKKEFEEETKYKDK